VKKKAMIELMTKNKLRNLRDCQQSPTSQRRDKYQITALRKNPTPIDGTLLRFSTFIY
jgi:hypothetical protein